MTSIILSDGTVARTISGPVFLFDTGGFIQRYFTISDAVAAASANSSIFVSADTYSLFVHEPEAVKVAVNGLTIQVPELGHQGLQPVFMLTDDAIGLTLVGGGDARIVGNNSDNALVGLVGNDGDNFLSGGSDSDRMSGGNGNDTYFVDNVNDVTSELVMSEGVGEVIGTGDDVVYASVDFTLAAGIEVLIQTDDAIHGTGNDDNNYLYGNSEANVLDGGLGRDIMIGGAGDDTYIVDQLGDTIIENAGEGTDTVYSGIGFALAANVENLVLTGTALQGFGNDGDNRISGNDGINVLYGGQGGVDMLHGGGGNDIFVITAEADYIFIEDFEVGDRLGLAGFGSGAQIVQESSRSFSVRDASGDVLQGFAVQSDFVDRALVESDDFYFA